jgi:hypothetical protein
MGMDANTVNRHARYQQLQGDIQTTIALTGITPKGVTSDYAAFATEVANVWRGVTPREAHRLGREWLRPEVAGVK